MTRPPRSPARPIPPLDGPALDRMALRYVEKFATTRGKLVEYLKRKIRERGWEGDPADPVALAERMAELGYIDDRAWAAARAAALGRRGLGAGRVRQELAAARVDAGDAESIAPAVADDAVESAMRLAKRKRIGPYALTPAERPVRQKQLAAMVRAGHGFALARAIVDAGPAAEGEEYACVRDQMPCGDK